MSLRRKIGYKKACQSASRLKSEMPNISLFYHDLDGRGWDFLCYNMDMNLKIGIVGLPNVGKST